MGAVDLPFDARAMLGGLRSWVECESPTWDAAAVNRMMRLAAHELAVVGAHIETIPGRMGFGDCLRARFPHPRADAPGILILGHMDTVHPLGTLARLPFREDGGRCYGPGILDMNGGNYLAIEAMRQLLRAEIQTPLPVTVLFTSDEEVGSPSTRDLIEAEAARHRYVLVPEPARADGSVVTGRYAIARFNLEALGRPSHAGLRPCRGTFGHPRHGTQDSRDRGDDDGELHLQRRCRSRRRVGELRAHGVPRRGAEHAKPISIRAWSASWLFP